MNETAKYMTVEECQLYRELAAKYGGSVLTMSVSLPCFQPHAKVENSSKKKLQIPSSFEQNLINR